MRRYLVCVFVVLLLPACGGMLGSTPAVPNTAPGSPLPPATLDAAHVRAGQTLYVPIYTHGYQLDRSIVFQLTATLNIANSDPDNPIVLSSVRYYDSVGKLVRTYIDQPVLLAPLATTDFVISTEHPTGSSGTGFVVEWVAEHEVAPPVVEAVMVGTISSQGFSFVSTGRVVKTIQKTQTERDQIPGN